MAADNSTKGRHRDACIACGAERPIGEWSVTSPFFSERAMKTKPQVISILKCATCETQYFDFLVTEDQLARLYSDYRGETYFKQRHRFEPWYTSAINSGMGGEFEMSKRRNALAEALAAVGIENSFNGVLDHGGDRGQMLKNLNADRKAVYEISGVATDPGIEVVGELDMRAGQWDLILSCHVLEHLVFPATFVKDLVSLGRPGTYYFVEVPDESIPTCRFNATLLQRRWLEWLIAHPSIFKCFDFLSTGIRARLGMTLPLMFFSLREHLTFFSLSGIRLLLAQNGLTVLSASVLPTGHIGVVAVKPR